MSRNVTSATKQALFASSTNQVFLMLVTLDHPDLGSPIRLVKNTEDIVSNGNLFSAARMEFSPPVEEEGTIKSSTITFGNVDQSIVTAVRSISSVPTVEISIIRAADPDVFEAGPWEFHLRMVSFKGLTVQGELSPDNPLQRKASKYRYTNTGFPGLFG